MQLIDSLLNKPVSLEFGTSGLRGLATDLTDLEAYINTISFLEFIKSAGDIKPGEEVLLAGDFRTSTKRIMEAVCRAILDSGCQPVNCGLIPTPALAYYGQVRNRPAIMVSGSHIPDNRNGIKFYKKTGEILKGDEGPIKQSVGVIREKLYGQDLSASSFDEKGQLKEKAKLPEVLKDAEQTYLSRYKEVFGGNKLKPKKIIVYQQSAVGRDIIVQVLEAAGANVIPIERLDYFLPIDTENVTPELRDHFREISARYPDAFAIVSADGDSDRPFVVDGDGVFYRGDILGVVVAEYLGAKFAAAPVSVNDAVDEYCQSRGIKLEHTKIGSPYVIAALESTRLAPAVGWEVNGGFILGSEITIDGKPLPALPTRDAMLPIIACLMSAADKNLSVKELFERLPKRYTGGALIDNVDEAKIKLFREHYDDRELIKEIVSQLFMSGDMGEIKGIDLLDGVRVKFTSGDVIHFRPSGNAPQFRIYSNSDSQVRADELADRAVSQGGYIEHLLDLLSKSVG